MAARRSPLELAQQHEKKGNLAKAAEAYSEYLSGNPSDARTLLRLAEIRERQGEAELAAEAFHQLGVLHRKDRMEAKAAAVLRRALQVLPSHGASVQLLVELLVTAGKKRDAINVLQATSLASAANGDSRARLQMLEQASKLDEGVSSQLLYAQALVEAGDKERARAVLRQAADHLAEQKAPLDRLQVLERLLQVSAGDPKAAIEAARAAIELRDYRRALISLRIGLEQEPENPELISLTGRVLHAMGEAARALLVFREAARAYARGGRKDEAKRNWLAVLRLNRDDPEASAAVGARGAAPAPPARRPRGPLADMNAQEFNDALSALEEQPAPSAEPASHEMVIAFDELEVDLSIELDKRSFD